MSSSGRTQSYGLLDVTSIDLLPRQNAEQHNTLKYEWQTERKIVTRRGYPVHVQLQTSGRYDPDVHVLVFEISIDESAPARESSAHRKFRVRSQDEYAPPGKAGDWSANIVEETGSGLLVKLTIPVSTGIGRWNVALYTGLWNERNQVSDLQATSLSRRSAALIYVVCNSFHSGDEVFMEEKKERDYYLFQEADAYYKGEGTGDAGYQQSRYHWVHSQVRTKYTNFR
ncbi:Transglutaminase [Aphelenchoides avenae]|nr:Transglutaminase [Aphelenchus avenae]